MLKLIHLQPDWALIEASALPLSLLLLALSLCLLAGALRRERRARQGELARIFEQLDLLRFDAQQAGAAATAPAPLPEPPGLAAGSTRRSDTRLIDSRLDSGDYYQAAQLAAHGSSAAEITERCGIVNGEARVLIALQRARAGRAELA